MKVGSNLGLALLHLHHVLRTNPSMHARKVGQLVVRVVGTVPEGKDIGVTLNQEIALDLQGKTRSPFKCFVTQMLCLSEAMSAFKTSNTHITRNSYTWVDRTSVNN